MKLIETYEKKKDGIIYAEGLCGICKAKDESEQDFKARIKDNLMILAKLQEYKNERVY